MKRTRHLVIGAAFVGLLAVLGTAQNLLQKSVEAQTNGAVQAPKFEVDPLWPKPLPNGWYQGQTIGVSVDACDHIWIIHRSDSLDAVEAAADSGTGECCKKAPPILEFDQDGTLLRHWGGTDGPGYQWPASNHGIWIDHKGFVWIGGNGGGSDGHILKFTQDGKFVREGIVNKNTMGATVSGQFGVVSSWGSAWDVAFSSDPQQQYVFVADGHDKKVVIVRRDTLAPAGSFGGGGRQPGRFLAVGSIATDSRGNVYTGEQHHGKRVQKWTPAGNR